MTYAIEVKASNARPTNTGVEGALDVDVAVRIDGTEVEGEVTLGKINGLWVAYGDAPDYWVSGGLLA